MPYIGKEPARVPVTAADIPDDSITAAKIVDGVITAADLAANSVDSSELVDGSIDTSHIGALQVTTAKIAADAVTGAKIADDSIDSEHYVAASIDNEHLADDAVGVAELSATGTASSSTYLRGDNSWATVTSVGGATGVDFNDNVKARFGTGNDLEMYHNGTHSFIADVGTGNLIIDTNATEVNINSGGNAKFMGRFIKDDAVKLYHNGSEKLATTSTGGTLTGTWTGEGLGDPGADGWILRADGTTENASAAIVDFGTEVHIGSNVSHSGGSITLGESGWYFVIYRMTHYASDSDNSNLHIRVSTTKQTSKVYWESNDPYEGRTGFGLMYAASGTTINIYGTGKWYGHNSVDSSTYFMGWMIGS